MESQDHEPTTCAATPKSAAPYGVADWRVDEDGRPGMEWNRHILDGVNNTVCFMAHGGGKHPEQDEARAHLVAAGPDLLEALEDLLAACEPGPAGDHEWAYQERANARAAIAKATGVSALPDTPALGDKSRADLNP